MKKFRLAFFCIAFVLQFSAIKAQFGGGDGTMFHPYLISNATHLNNIKLTDDEGNYLYLHLAFIQGADIDLDVSPYNEEAGWEPIGTADHPFTGQYDGNDYAIINLFINRPAEDNIGLFGVTEGADLTDIALTDVDITGHEMVGALAGSFLSNSGVNRNEFEFRSQLKSSGTVDGENMVGGLIGYADNSIIRYAHSECTISGVNFIGGLVGQLDETDLQLSSSNAVVSGSSDNIGGLAGRAYESQISQCCAVANLESTGSGIHTGGLVGYLYSSSSLTNCWVSGTVNGQGHTGGATGYNNGSTITNCFSYAAVTGDGVYVGGLAGRNNSDVTNSYWDTQVSGVPEPGAGDGRTTEEMTYPSAADTYVDWNFSTIWVEDPDIGFGHFNNGYPYLKWQHNPQKYGFAGGSGTEADPYLVATAAHLNSVRNKHEAWFLQTADIDLGAAPWNEGTGWKPIKGIMNDFRGHYNGNHFAIQNLTIDETGDYFGLFRYLFNAAISNVILEDIQISGRDYSAGLTGKAENTVIENCTVSGNLSGRYYVGGLAGEIINLTTITECETGVDILGSEYVGGLLGQATNGTVAECSVNGAVETTSNYAGGLAAYIISTDVSDCNTSGDVTGNSSTGGLIGIMSESSIEQSFTTGNITGGQNTGGLVGYNWSGSSITNSWSRGMVSGNSTYLGGFVGNNMSGNTIINSFSTGVVNGLTAAQGFIGQGSGTVVDCFWDTETSGDSGSTGGGIGLTTAEMKNLSAFTNEALPDLNTAWDFVGNPLDDDAGEDYWDLDGTFNDGYPFLSRQKERIIWNGDESSDPGVGGNWNSGSTPLAGDNVLVASSAANPLVVNRTPALPLFYNSLFIESGATVEIDAEKALTVSGYLHSEGTLELKSNAAGTGSLIHNNSGVEATIGRYMTGGWASWDAGWHSISSPVKLQPIANFVTEGEGNGYDFFGWDETTNTWMNHKAEDFEAWNEGVNFNPGQGYLISYQQNQSEIAFEGELNTDNISVSNLSFTEDEGNGWHLLGNPFCSALAWNDGNWALNNVAGVAKIWNEAAKSYADIGIGGIIPSAQGFFVQVSEAANSLVIPAASRTHNTQSWYKSGENNEIILFAEESNGNSSQETKIAIHPDASDNYDFDYDSRFLPGYAPQFYSTVGAEKISTNSLPYLNEETVIPMGFVKNQGNSYSIQLKQTIENLDIIMVDLQTGVYHHFSQSSIYSFAAATSDDPNRFVLKFSPTGIEESSENDPMKVFSHGKTITILNPKKLSGILRVFNISGQEVNRQKINGDETFRTDTGLSAGVYIVNVIIPEGIIKQKIIIQ
jgi:hypothetical protein